MTDLKNEIINKKIAESTSNILIPDISAIENGIAFKSNIDSNVLNGYYNLLSKSIQFLQFTGGLYSEEADYNEGNIASIVVKNANDYSIWQFRRNANNPQVLNNNPPIAGATILKVNGVDAYEGGTLNTDWDKLTEDYSVLPLPNTAMGRDEEGSSNVNMPNNITDTTIINNKYLKEQLSKIISNGKAINVYDNDTDYKENDLICIEVEITTPDENTVEIQVFQKNQPFMLDNNPYVANEDISIHIPKYLYDIIYNKTTDNIPEGATEESLQEELFNLLRKKIASNPSCATKGTIVNVGETFEKNDYIYTCKQQTYYFGNNELNGLYAVLENPYYFDKIKKITENDLKQEYDYVALMDPNNYTLKKVVKINVDNSWDKANGYGLILTINNGVKQEYLGSSVSTITGKGSMYLVLGFGYYTLQANPDKLDTTNNFCFIQDKIGNNLLPDKQRTRMNELKEIIPFQGNLYLCVRKE